MVLVFTYYQVPDKQIYLLNYCNVELLALFKVRSSTLQQLNKYKYLFIRYLRVQKSLKSFDKYSGEKIQKLVMTSIQVSIYAGPLHRLVFADSLIQASFPSLVLIECGTRYTASQSLTPLTSQEYALQWTVNISALSCALLWFSHSG